MPKINLTEDQKIAIRKMRDAFGMSWHDIGRRIGVHHSVVRGAVEPDYARLLHERERSRARDRRPRLEAGIRMDTISIPQSVEDQRQRYLNAPHRSIADRILGCPPKGFSALDRKLAEGRI